MQSHLLEVLFEGIKTSLYKEGANPFPKATIAVPSYGLKRWLSHRLAKEWGIFFGIQIVTLEQLVANLNQSKQPTSYESALAIYPHIRDVDELQSYFETANDSEIGLANELATLFTRYGLYGEGKIEGWQKKMWNRLPPYWFDLLQNKVMEEGRTYHLFGFSYIPPLFLKYLKDVHLWLFSPSSTYFADVEMNVLGGLSKRMQQQLQDLDIELDSLHPIVEPQSCLERVQRDIVLMEKGDPLVDDSVQLHASPNKQREVEVLYEQLMDAGVDPMEVVVMAPDITSYIPYIRGIFEREDSCFSAMIFDREKGAQNPFWHLLQDLMDLRKSRFERDKVLALFEHRPFTRKWGLSHEDVSLLKRWIEEAGVFWGKNPYPQEKRGTWEGGIEWLMDHLVFFQGEESLLHDLVPLSKVHLLGILSDIIEALQSVSKKDEGTLPEWHEFFKGLIEAHMQPGDEGLYQELMQGVEAILVPFSALHENLYPYEMVWARVKSVMEEKSGVEGENQLSAIPFASLTTYRAAPKKWIYLLGMNEGEFPRIVSKSTLDLLNCVPEKKDEDREIFLETLLSCRKQLVISYIFSEEKARSSLVETLVDHLGGELVETIHHLDVPPRKEEEPFLLSVESEKREVIFVEDLLCSASDPLKNFFKESLEFRLATMEVKEESIEPLQFSALDRYKLRQMVRRGDSKVTLEKIQNKLPFGPYLELAVQEVEQTHEEFLEFEIEKVWDVEFKSTCQEREFLGEHKILLPSLILEGVKIEGTLKNVSKEGILCEEKGTFTDHLKNWPKLLLAHFLDGVEPRLLYPRTGKQFAVKPENVEKTFLKFIDFYHTTLEKPAITYPEWGGYFLKQSEEEAVKKIRHSVKQDGFQRVSPYREYGLRGVDLSPENIGFWQEKYKFAFGEILS